MVTNMRRGPKSGFWFAGAGLPFLGAALMGENLFHYSYDLKRVIFLACLFLGVLCIVVGAFKEVEEERHDRTSGRGRKMIAIYGMLVSFLFFAGFAALYFWPSEPIPDKSAESVPLEKGVPSAPPGQSGGQQAGSTIINTGPVYNAPVSIHPRPEIEKEITDIGVPTWIEPPEKYRFNADGSPRTFVGISPNQLKKLIEGKTQDQARKLSDDYLGKWMAFSGTVEDIKTVNDHGPAVMVGFASSKSIFSGSMLAQAFFPIKWKAKLDLYVIGSNVKAVGRISDVTSFAMAFDRCELIE